MGIKHHAYKKEKAEWAMAGKRHRRSEKRKPPKGKAELELCAGIWLTADRKKKGEQA